jgi:hypothetical protein
MPREEGGVVRRLILVLATIGVAVLLASGAALGITNGTPDVQDSNGEYRYPYVGALVDNFDGETYPYCTGTLISSTVLVTAAHCYPETSVKEDFGVTFDPVYDPDDPKDPNDPSTALIKAAAWKEHPTIDIGVVKFAQPVSGITPAKLPTAGQVARQAKATNEFTAVGYGGELAPKEPGGPLIVYGDRRESAVSTFKSYNGTYLRLSQNQGSGGTCYGDSGGPNFFGEYGSDYDNDPATSLPRPTIASTTITGDTWCKATNVTLRLDTTKVRDFLRGYVTLPQ